MLRVTRQSRNSRHESEFNLGLSPRLAGYPRMAAVSGGIILGMLAYIIVISIILVYWVITMDSAGYAGQVLVNRTETAT